MRMSKVINGLSSDSSRQVGSIPTITTMNIDIIMRNTFAVVTNRCEIDDILELYKGEDAMFYGNPLDMTVEDIDEVINYFENTEEYENCQQLLYVKNDKVAEIITKKLMRDAL